MLIDKLLVVGDNRLSDSLTDSVDLRSMTTSRDTDADIDFGESLETDNQERLIDLETEDLGLDEVERGAVDLDESTTFLVGY